MRPARNAPEPPGHFFLGARAPWRPTLLALACLGQAGCAALPAAVAGIAAQVSGVAAVATLGAIDAQQQSGKDRCAAATARGLAVSETLETAFPTTEGDVLQFGPLFWQTGMQQAGQAAIEPGRKVIEAKLGVTRQSLSFVPEAGATSVRIPLALVEGVDLRRDPAGGSADAMVVRSCFGRADLVTLPAPRGGSRDPEALAAMTAQVAARVKESQGAAGR